MTYSWRVRFAMIHTEREREEPSCRRHDIHCSDRHAAERSEGALPGNEDRQDAIGLRKIIRFKYYSPSDARKVASEKLKTVIRHPIKEKGSR